MDRVSLSIAEACAITGIGRTLLYQAIRDNRIPVRKWNRRSLILKTDLENFLSKLPTQN